MPVTKRIAYDHTLEFRGEPDTIFPLLCPVREYEWIPGWTCELVHSQSGVIEPGCVFRTRYLDTDVTWHAVEHDPARHRVGFAQFYRDLAVAHLSLALEAKGPGKTICRIRHTFTALSPQAVARLDAIGDNRAGEIARLEQLMNAFLDRQRSAAG